MNELIPIIECNSRKAVSARHLHAFLENKKQFSDWIKHRIQKYDLVENRDYQSFSLIGENGGKSIEYALSIEAAKELSMVEGSPRGKQARQYFIACESLLKGIAAGELSHEKKKLRVLQEKSYQVLEIDRNINCLLKRRRKLNREINEIIRSGDMQLDLPFEETPSLSNGFPHKRRLKIS